MIEEAGFGVTVKGSAPNIIEISDYVTASNDNDGVAKVLEKILQ